MTTTHLARTAAAAEPTAPAARAASRRRVRADFNGLPWEWRVLTPLALAAVWQLASAVGWLKPQTLAPPSAILHRAALLVQDGTLPQALLHSVTRAGLGFLLGSVIAIAAGLAVGLSRAADAVVDPPMQMLRAVPLLGVVPLFIIWFGIGEFSKVLLVALGVAVPLYLNLVAGLRSVDPQLYDVADSLRLTNRERLQHILLPGALPGALVGLRQALAFAWLALIVAEQISATSGLGFMINNARDFLQTDTIVVGLVTYALLGLVTDGLVRLLERRALRWRDVATEGAAR
ncbi:ABC transporter permease [Flexivirga meconopsidis]|uniref:ABC transporter permease n=1 Tax=Flexivirga meconopsidis TaxID=2977121 RepID=UPI00223EF359|nr:ABC transporter permease [Flexivirga meconopsidis]